MKFNPKGKLLLTLVKFSKEGKYLMEWGKKGKSEGEFNLPHAICTDSKGRVYVGDRENDRIQVFDGEGKFLALWTETGHGFQGCGLRHRDQGPKGAEVRGQERLIHSG